MFVPKMGWNYSYIYVLVGELWKYSCIMGYLWTAFMPRFHNSGDTSKAKLTAVIYCYLTKRMTPQGGTQFVYVVHQTFLVLQKWVRLARLMLSNKSLL